MEVQVSKEELRKIIQEEVKREFEKWFEAYQKYLDSLIPEEEPEEDEIEAINKEEELIDLEEIINVQDKTKEER